MTEWTAVPKGTTNAGIYEYGGSFSLTQRETNATMLMITSELSEKQQSAPAPGSVLQHYIQFRGWDMQGNSYMDFVCNTAITSTGHTITKQGSCGSEILAGITVGPYGRVKGSKVQDSTTCNVDAVLSID